MVISWPELETLGEVQTLDLQGATDQTPAVVFVLKLQSLFTAC